jgi:hypothetical protein
LIGIKSIYFGFGRLDREEKRRPLIGLRFGPNPPTVFANNALHYRQSHPRSFEVAGLVEALKNSEEFGCVLHLEAGPVVANKDHALIVLPPMPHLDHSPFLFARVYLTALESKFTNTCLINAGSHWALNSSPTCQSTCLGRPPAHHASESPSVP